MRQHTKIQSTGIMVDKINRQYIFEFISFGISSLTVPSGYPINVVATPFSPTAVRVQWGPVSAIDRNGVISQYEVLFNQSTVGNLPRTNTGVNNSEFSAVVSPLQPFITYTISVRALTSVGHGPLNPSPVVTMTDPSGESVHCVSLHITLVLSRLIGQAFIT